MSRGGKQFFSIIYSVLYVSMNVWVCMDVLLLWHDLPEAWPDLLQRLGHIRTRIAGATHTNKHKKGEGEGGSETQGRESREEMDVDGYTEAASTCMSYESFLSNLYLSYSIRSDSISIDTICPTVCVGSGRRGGSPVPTETAPPASPTYPQHNRNNTKQSQHPAISNFTIVRITKDGAFR